MDIETLDPMKLKNILLITISLLALGTLVFVLFLSQLKMDMSSIVKPLFKSSEPRLFLKDIDFSDGDYVLAVRRNHQKPVKLIDDENALIENRDSIRTKANILLSFVPGEGGFGKALFLFKDGKLIKSATAKVFKIFDTGTVESKGKDAETKYFEGVKSDFLAEKRKILKRSKTYIFQDAEVDPEGYEYTFSIKLPSLVTPDTLFDPKVLAKELYGQIVNDLSSFEGFRISNLNNQTAYYSSLDKLLLFDTRKYDYIFLQTADKTVLTLDDWKKYDYELYFNATEEFYHQIKSLDFEKYLTPKIRNREELIALLKTKATQASPAIQWENVGVRGYRDQVVITHLQEKKYSLHYFELYETPLNSPSSKKTTLIK